MPQFNFNFPFGSSGTSQQDYIATIYGDSFSDSGGGTGWIGQTLNTQTSKNFTIREVATGGFTVAQIKTAFLADFPYAGDNLVIIQGAINSIRTDVALATIQTDMAVMLDAVIADGNYELLVVNQTPWKGHADWTSGRQTVTEDYNAWLLANYAPYLADIYTALGDPGDSEQLADEFYKAARTDAHPSRNGDSIIDDNLGEYLYHNTPNITRSAEASNVHPFPNTPASWGNILRATIGGNSVRLCDGTTSSVNGVIPSSDAISAVARHNWATGLGNEVSVTAKALIKPGQHQWVKFEYRDNAAAVTIKYFDLVNIAIGAAGSGSATPAIQKAARGWVEVSLTGSNGTGANTNWININPAEDDGDENFVGDVRTPSVYVDRVQLIVN